jgi:hypothetical protein
MATVETKRANSAYVYRMADGAHEWDYGNGQVVRCNPDKGSAQARHFLLNYGIKQWIQDGGAVSAGDDGKVNPEDKFNGMRERAELIESGVDVLVRRGGPKGDDEGLLMQALMRAQGWTSEQASAWVTKVMSAKGLERKAVMANVAKNPKVILAVGEIKAERATKSSVDAGDLLAEMDEEAAE